MATRERTVVLKIWAHGTETRYHITVARVTLAPPSTPDTVINALVSKHRNYVGRNALYSVQGPPVKWGQNSFFIDFHTAEGVSLDTVRQGMFADLTTMAGVGIVTTRYPQTGGLAPQHVDTRGMIPPFASGITFAVAVL